MVGRWGGASMHKNCKKKRKKKENEEEEKRLSVVRQHVTLSSILVGWLLIFFDLVTRGWTGPVVAGERQRMRIGSSLLTGLCTRLSSAYTHTGHPHGDGNALLLPLLCTRMDGLHTRTFSIISYYTRYISYSCPRKFADRVFMSGCSPVCVFSSPHLDLHPDSSFFGSPLALVAFLLP